MAKRKTTTAAKAPAKGGGADGGKINSSMGLKYRTTAFGTIVNSFYNPVENMIASVKLLTKLEGGAAFLRTMKWGDYQPILVTALGKTWPQDTSETTWKKDSAAARASLATQTNARTLHKSTKAVPVSKCDLLDEAVRLCFTSTVPGQKSPGIPMAIKVELKGANDADKTAHNLLLRWTYDANGAPVKLALTMVCPYPG